VRYTCDGANQSPPLQWSKLPSGTVQLFMFVLDLAGGPKGTVRWVVGGISPSVHSIAAGSPPPGSIVGQNSEGKADWAGICPAKKNTPHSIIFLLYALRQKLSLKPGFKTASVQRQLGAITAGEGLTIGTYTRH
jgi:phosphatidylethanolamine-binding protein (PEBP) family uncharacterized protein